MCQKQLINAISNMQVTIGNRIDGECTKEELDFLHEMWEWINDILAEVYR